MYIIYSFSIYKLVYPLNAQDRIGGPSLAISEQKEPRSPRAQRSYSAEIDFLQKTQAVRRTEDRRYTDFGEAGRWMPSSKQVSKTKRLPFPTQDSIEEEEDAIQADKATWESDQSELRDQEERSHGKQISPRTKMSEAFSAGEHDTMVPMKNTKSHATRSHSAGATCSRSRDHSSFGSPPSRPCRERRYTDTTLDPPGWDSPTIGFVCDDVFQANQHSEDAKSASLGSTPTGTVRRGITEQRDYKRSPSSEPARCTTGVNQRIRDLYDFKVETEWPRKARHPPRKNFWISKSRSDEKEHHESSASKERNADVLQKRAFEDLDEDEREERLRIFHEKLRFSEDLGQPIDQRERRLHSADDFGNERACRQIWSAKRTSRGSRESWISYTEISQARQESRVSDASYVSIEVFERSVEASTRKAFSQGDEPTPSSSTPPTPPSTPMSKNSTGKRNPHPKPERQGSKFKIYLV
ncbi:uncharacterized protein LOC124416328 [Diprion similis]|uniref:uncharacterized protein LOC124416328 n=1 Tax=Diprion similis TaxID=362088 RepID=UPI001EF87820|nr:uncharacterized protein LOC124416328 [Diprion similis]